MLWRRSSVICDTALLIEAGPSAARGSIWRRLRPKLSSVLGLAAAVAGVGDPTAAVPGAEGPGAAAPGAAGPTAEADATLGAEGADCNCRADSAAVVASDCADMASAS